MKVFCYLYPLYGEEMLPEKNNFFTFCVAKKFELFYFYYEMNDFNEIVKQKELEFFNPETIFIFLKIFIL